MPTSNAPHEASQQISEGTRGPEDDFYCQKYQVWYRLQDCVYRGRNKTFAGCENCFQGFLNIKSFEGGCKPPVFPALDDSDPAAVKGAVLPFVPTRDR